MASCAPAPWASAWATRSDAACVTAEMPAWGSTGPGRHPRTFPATGDSKVVMPVNHGEMQAFTLTLDKFLGHAARWHPDVDVVTAREAGNSDRIGYARLMQRSRRLSSVFAGLGVRMG